MKIIDPQAIKKYILAVDVGVIMMLVVIFGFFYVTQHAWGSWGDDSPGYIYTAGQFIKGESLVSQDALVQSALQSFGDEKLARFVAPTHHEIISPDGWIASKYPIGLSWLMYLVATVFNSDNIIYLVVPVLAIGTVVLTYLLSIVWIPGDLLLKRVVGIIAALSLGLSNLFANYAVAQPMRDIPALFFFVLAAVLAGILINKTRKKNISIILILILAGLSFGFSINIRETSVILAIPLLIVLFYGVKKSTLKGTLIKGGIFTIALLMSLSLTIWNSYNISVHQENFKEKDLSGIAITSNFDHITSLSFKNIYNNQGKFRPGVGGAKQYWDVLNQYSDWPPFLFVAIIGLFLLLYKHRREGLFFFSWIAVVFLLFSMWINPYPRYILALFPAVAILAGYGIVGSIVLLQKVFSLRKLGWAVLSSVIIISFFISLETSVLARETAILEEELVYKAISHNDLIGLEQITKSIVEHSKKEPLLLMLGQWKSGISETLMTHNNLRVIRYPRKTNEQPDFDDFVSYINELEQTYDVYLWYDSSTNADEQKFFTAFETTFLTSQDFTFQANVEIYYADTAIR